MKPPPGLSQIEEIFHAALEHESAQRAAFLAQACASDPDLLDAVKALLDAHEQSFSLLDQHHAAAEFDDTSDPTRHLPSAPAPQPAPPPNSHSSGDGQREGRFVTGAMLSQRYRIVGLLGKGGMGEVYKADDLKLNQTVALKFLPESIALDGGMLARFHNEVRIARQVAHPNVCRVYDIGEVEGLHFLSMEFIDGEDLSSLLRRIGRLPGDKAVELARQMCAGLAAAHEAGVLHRDLKPANVMIDGRGKARITDFGLAVVSEELRGDEVMAGTPAYMAPEQLMGKEVTQRSDIYALGLVLYELFTGKRVFEAKSIQELISLHEKSTPPTPSSHVKDIDPLAERVILRCLAKDPKARPASAVQVALALPGGDPLQAALAMGETPSPEMVAASGEKTGLRPKVAVACLLAIIIGLVAMAFLSRKTSLIEQVPLPYPPEVLASKAREALRQFGYPDQPTDTAYGFAFDYEYLNFQQTQESPATRWTHLAQGRPAAVYFWYRESPQYLQPQFMIELAAGRDRTQVAPRVTENDPPSLASGMLSVKVDTLGRLLRFSAVPPQIDAPGRSDTSPSQPDWKVLLTAAGLDPAHLTETKPEWRPLSGYDVRAAWTGTYAEQIEVPIRIEAAALQGQPVYFEILSPWTKPDRVIDQIAGRSKARYLLGHFLLLISIIGIILLVRYNLRQGRGDRRGAIRISLFTFVIWLLHWMVGASHVPAVQEFNFLYTAIAAALWGASFYGLAYLAVEPFVRRRWPGILISWNRLLTGKFDDALVGRDILVGLIFGIVIILLRMLWFGVMRGRSDGIASSLLGVRYAASQFIILSLHPVLIALFQLTILFLLSMLSRRRWLVMGLFILYGTAMSQLSIGTSWSSVIYFAAGSAIHFSLLTRYGFVAEMASLFVIYIQENIPFTTDFTRWYAGTSLAALLVILALATFAFYTSLGGQKVFQDSLLEDGTS